MGKKARGRGGFRGRGRGGNARGRGHGRRHHVLGMDMDLMSFVEMQEKEIARNASKSDRGRGGRGRGRGRGARGQARGGARGRGGSLSMTSQNRVPFDYRAAQRNATDPPAEGEQEWELEVNLTMEDDEEEEDEDEDEDEEDEDEDFVIEAHKSMERTVAARRRMEGLYLNEHQQVIEKKEYNVLAMLKHANPLRRPILFVKASGVYDKGDKATPELEPMPKEAAKPATKEATKPAFKETPKPTPKETFKTAPKPTKADAVPPTTRDEASRSASDPPSVTPVRSPKRLKHAQHNDWADDFLSLRLADQILESDAPRKPVSEQDAILADWLENAMLGDMSSMDVPDIPGITTDPFGPATTLEDIAIDAHEREQDAWESGSESDADSDEFDMDEWHATMLQRVGASPESESDDEDMALDNLGSDAFLSDQGRVPPTSARMPPQFQDSLWADELQAQWEKDRSRKASKKKQREAARQAAAFDPFPNTHGHANTTRKSKKQRKQETRERRAALKALAEDEDATAPPAPPHSFAQINEWITRFLDDSGRTTLSLPPMRKRDRAMVHNLADAYALKSKSRGQGQSRCPILYKTSRTGKSVDHKRVSRLIRTPFGTMDDDTFDHRGLGRTGRVRIDIAPRHREGAQVGGGAKQIAEDNIGHQLLRSMGWTTGEGLGQSKGRAEPVLATVKMSRSGLGM